MKSLALFSTTCTAVRAKFSAPALPRAWWSAGTASTPRAAHLGVYALDFRVRICGEDIDRHHDGQAEAADIFDVFFEVFNAFFDCCDIGPRDPFKRDTAVGFERTHRCHEHHEIGCQAALTAFDIEKFFRSQIGAKARFGNGVFREPQSQAGGGNGIAAVRDVGKGAAVD